MTEHTEMKTRADGSIDTAHYLARGRTLRSIAFWDALRKLRPSFGVGRRFASRIGTGRSPATVPTRAVPAE